MYLLYARGRHAHEHLGAANKTTHTHTHTHTHAEGCDSGRQPLEVYKGRIFRNGEQRCLKGRRKTSDCGARKTGLKPALPSTSRGTLGRPFVSLSLSFLNYKMEMIIPPWEVCVHAQSVNHVCPILCEPMDCSPPGSSVHWILQARILV